MSEERKRNVWTTALLTAALFFWSGCDQYGRPEAEPDPRNTDVACRAGVVASTSGEVRRTFPLTSPAAPAPIEKAAATRLTVFGDDYVLANAPNVSKVYNGTHGRALFDLPAAWSASVARGRNEVYLAQDQVGRYEFDDAISLKQTLLGSSIHALQPQEGDTTSNKLHEVATQRYDSTRYVTRRLLNPLPAGANGDVLFFQEKEVVTVSADSTGENVYENRYSFERSLWRFSRSAGTANRLMDLPDPKQEATIPFADVTPDGQHIVYQDGRISYYVNLEKRQVTEFKEGTLEGSGAVSSPIVSPAGRLVVGLRSSCPQSYMIEQTASGEEGFILYTHQCGVNTATFGPKDEYIYTSDWRYEKESDQAVVGVWRARRSSRYRGHQTNAQDHATNVVRLSDTLGIVENHDEASLSNPAFLSPTTFVVLHTFGRSEPQYNEDCQQN